MARLEMAIDLFDVQQQNEGYDSSSSVDVPGRVSSDGVGWRLNFPATATTLAGRYFAHMSEIDMIVDRREIDVPVTTPGETASIQVNIDVAPLVFSRL